MSKTADAAVAAIRAPIPRAELDEILVAQLAISWAGEGGEEPRLGWWPSDLTSEFGGEDLFQRLHPRTWRWATLQGAHDAAQGGAPRHVQRATPPTASCGSSAWNLRSMNGLTNVSRS